MEEHKVIGHCLQIDQFALASYDKAFVLPMKSSQQTGSCNPEVRDEVRRYIGDSTGPQIIIPQARTQSLGIADKPAPQFSDMSWTLLEPRHAFFVTSDDPTVRNAAGDRGFHKKTI